MTNRIFIEGDPYPAQKKTGNVKAPAAWSRLIVDATQGMDRVGGPCRLDVEFILNQAKFTGDTPYGTDLDNLLKRLFDALGRTVLAEAKRKDSAIVEVHATKRWAAREEPAGVWLEVTPRPWP